MVIHYLHIIGIIVNPLKTNSPLIVYPNAVLAGSVCALARRSALDADPAAVAAARSGARVHGVDLTRFICDSRRCFPVVGGALVYKDQHHLTTVYAQSLGPYLQRAVEGRRERVVAAKTSLTAPGP